MRGRFIVLEGPDGSGTTTHSALLAESLKNSGQRVLLTQEPSNGPVGTFLRSQLAIGGVPSDALQILFSADRAWHLTDVILPSLEDGKTVICDRYILSTLLYGQALGLDTSWLSDMNKKFIQPDLQIVALPPFSVCQERINARGTKDMLEEQTSFQQSVYDLYAAAAKQNGLPVINTEGSAEEVARHIRELVQ